MVVALNVDIKKLAVELDVLTREEAVLWILSEL